MILHKWINYIIYICYSLISKVKLHVYNNSIQILVRRPEDALFVLSFFKLHSKLLFLSLVDITAVDCLALQKEKCTQNTSGRFKVVYILLSHYFSTRIVIECYVDENKDLLSSSNLYKAAPWLEREIWDMFGLFFSNHDDLRRILTDYGFEGFPLRKDFPVTGYTEIRYDDTKKCLVYESLELTQEYRAFDTLSPWVIVL